MKILSFFFGLFYSVACLALSGQAYMDRFNAYRTWYQNLPANPASDFFEFIQGEAPLSQKLRGKWLYEVAKNKDWRTYLSYYQPTTDLNLLCYKQIALFNTGQQDEAMRTSIPLWLTGDSLPPACTRLFDNLLQMNSFDQNLITQRLILALNQRNMPLAYYLLKQYKTSHAREMQSLMSIYKNPTNIALLAKSDLIDDFYLYGLKRLVSMNMDKALIFWKKAKHLLSEPQEQAFLAHVTLYKAMRNQSDTIFWFNKVKPKFYNEVLVDWAIRYALKQKDWPRVSQFIHASTNKDTPCWQYWLARSLEAQGQKPQAKTLYQSLAKSRNYYGFLASMRLNQSPSLELEKTTTNLLALKPYQSILSEIQSLYQSKKSVDASRLLSDFISELPKEEASALLYWVDTHLHWYGRSVYLSSNEVLNNQLLLRFPLAYQDSIRQFARQYGVKPEFVYAIIRQESAFREDVVSSAGARGLMQLMPKTAALVSKMSKISYVNQNQLFLSQKNINLGIAYLRQLGMRFHHHPVLIAAAYNAGPRQVVYWLKNHPTNEVDLWIETLPWQETRNYLKNVLAYYVVYQYRLNQKSDLKQIMSSL